MDRRTLQLIFSAIRNSFKETSRFQETLNSSLSATTGPKGGRRYTCHTCGSLLTIKELEIHHQIPCTPYNKYWYELTVDEYYTRVFTLPIVVLCKPCHKAETKQQNKLRKAAKK